MMARDESKCARTNWVEVVPKAMISPKKSKVKSKRPNLETILEEGSDNIEIVQNKVAMLMLPVLVSSLSCFLLYRLDSVSF